MTSHYIVKKSKHWDNKQDIIRLIIYDNGGTITLNELIQILQPWYNDTRRKSTCAKVFRHINKMMKKGLLERIDKGVYRLLYDDSLKESYLPPESKQVTIF
ncbi:MAG: hypothetical protein HRT61_00780 [Ekhidna sp.]|nr:hypothetical protein [Ekhidna sp.]